LVPAGHRQPVEAEEPDRQTSTARSKEAAADLNVGVAEALGTDYFYIREQLTPTQLDYLARAREFVTAEVQPVIDGYWERAEFPWPLISKLAPLGLAGDGIEGYGCPVMDRISARLTYMGLARGDGSLATFVGVQAGLAMQSIARCGSEEQKQRWLPPMAGWRRSARSR
jgi:glutaryl-CoA dehydrogenase